jgi:hypothetical protein
MSTDREMRAVSGRSEALIAELEATPDAAVRNRIAELVRLLLQLHGEALARMTQALQDPGFAADQASERFAADPVVASVLMLHDLHPHDLRTRIERALDLLRASLGVQASLALVAISDEIVRIRLDLPPGGCGMPPERIRSTVEAAIRDAAPDLREIEVEAASRDRAAPSLIQLTRR